MNPYENEACASGANPRSNLPRMLAPLRAERTTGPDGASSEILLAAATTDTETAAAVAELARRLELPAESCSDDGHLVVGGRRCENLGATRVPNDVEATLVDGPIEPGDVRAIATARAAGASALTADLRASVTVRIDRDRMVTVEARDESDALIFVAERLRRYVAALRDQPIEEVARPDLELVDRILYRTGSIQIRPIETEVYSTAIDIGIVTSTSTLGPADTSLIYDVYANSWHGD
jgi:hypothetical protein